MYIETISEVNVEYCFSDLNSTSNQQDFITYNGSSIPITHSGQLIVRTWKNYYVPNNLTAKYYVDEINFQYSKSSETEQSSNRNESDSYYHQYVNESSSNYSLSNIQYNYWVSLLIYLNKHKH